MAIKTSIKKAKEAKEVQEETPFPKLMVSNISGVIVFFTSSQVGVIVFRGSGDDKVGSECNRWRMGAFVDYTIVASVPEEVVEKELPFPKLMIAKDSKEIILFSKEEEGVVVYVTENSVTSLYYKSTCWDMSEFEDFKGKLTLQNEEI
tara:strand:+ start:185 stop:628 length:444 start_codon:yes stop_codon:yes gene_type:complete